ncbi:MAG: hypothetical protein A3D65_01960 [Candidatus Lloydbacteria bacterium RIFCSPHIGHO2_02_FULL_50_13]|uniref:Uncharacterized protein n=1 Tax=Candidatus Lloydbacteria bacterium RIFCSPHIGHO2_02_FULL_50_13 TaxID=1798661 RepID=A0A1G2D7C3_9BACT|nr:MAG: hypothetical protein A3D65_01960 [Candidatus Lloydbacteria bacterium RIFCSPHIGHO2_02_FULL_50_13]
MFRKLLAVLAVFCVLALPLVGHAAKTQVVPSVTNLSPQDRNCVEKMRVAVDQYIQRIGTYPGTYPRSIKVVTLNDLMCTDPEWMGNVVVVVEVRKLHNVHSGTDATEGWWFGIFHIHFLPDGTFRSAASINDPTWTPMRSEIGWRPDWCDLLRTVYPEDFKKECVPERSTTPQE